MLTPEDLATIQADLAAVSGDAERPITYRRYVRTDPGDPVLGIPAQDVYDDEATMATVRELTVEEVQLSGGAYTIGDLEFGVRRDAADARDRIMYAGHTWQPVEIRQVYLGGRVLRWLLRCKRV